MNYFFLLPIINQQLRKRGKPMSVTQTDDRLEKLEEHLKVWGCSRK